MRRTVHRPQPTARRRVRANLYFVIRRAVEEGAEYGWHRAHKYGDPADETACEAIADAVMSELCEVLEFDE